MSKPSSANAPWSCVCLLLLAACGPAPVIASFTASQDHIAYGDKTTLNWSVANTTALSISGGVGDLPATQLSVDVTPTQTTTYVLSARNGSGSPVTASVTVTLIPKLQLAGGTYNGDSLGLTVAAVLRDAAGAVPTTNAVVNITPPSGSPFTVNCPANKPLCLASLPGTAPVNGSYSASTTLGGNALTATFFVSTASRLTLASPIWIKQVDSQTLQGSWAAVPGAVSYRAWPVDLSAPTQPVGPLQLVSSTSATLPTTQPMDSSHQYGVRVEASTLDLTLAAAPTPLPAPNMSNALGNHLGGTPNAWQYLAPSNYQGNTLTVSFNDLGLTEQLAVLVLNAGGQDNASATLSVSGTQPLPPPPLAALMATATGPADRDFALRSPPGAHEREREEEAAVVADLFRTRGTTALPQAQVLPAPPAPAPTSLSFCVRQGQGTTFVKKPATLLHESTHALFYVDNQDASDYTAQAPGIWSSLDNSWENQAYPGDTQTFGGESDVDHNGKLIIFFTHELGAPQNGGILLGYYTPLDVAYALDTTANCSGTRSNQADMFYMNSLSNILAAYSGSNPPVTASDIYTQTYPNTLAHEFQHLINFNQHCLVRNCSNTEDVWINEGLSMVAQEIGGFGWNTSRGRKDGALYLDRRSNSPVLSYNGRGLTKWEADPIGNYEGAHAFVRYYADRLGPSVLAALVQTSEVGLPNLQNALGGLPFARSFAEWATAMMFSNEAFTPTPNQFDFQGASWTPLHTQLRHLNYVTLSPGSPQSLTLRQDGWNAFLTGSTTSGAATLTVTSSETVKPTVVVVRFSGSLPLQ